MTPIPATMRALPFAVLVLCALPAFNQTAPPPNPNPTRMTRSERADRREQAPLTTFRLKYATSGNDGNELLTAMRLMLDPNVKLYLDSRENAILMRGLPEEVTEASSIIEQLDRPRANYRLTFTLNELDGSRKVASHDYSMTLLDGQRVTLRQGLRVPVVTGKLEGTGTAVESQMTYVDVGLNFDATVNSNAIGGILKEKLEQSSLPEVIPPGTTDPTLHQTVMEGVTNLQLGHTTQLGTLDSQGPSHRTEVEVKLEKLP